MVWERSRMCGRAYDHHGPHGATPEGIRTYLQDVYEEVWHHDMDDDVRDIVNTLRVSGAFPAAAE